MFIVKWEKGIFKALGLHHALIACLPILAVSFIDIRLSFVVYGFFIGYYFLKELSENGDKFEIFDLASPIIFGALTIWGVSWVL